MKNMHDWIKLLFALVLFAAGPAALGQEYASDERPGIEEKLGEVIPLDLTFNDEEGKPVTLGSLIDRPTVLTLVYFRCPSICSPLMHELAAAVDKIDLETGIDYNLITISFDDREGPDLARTAKKNLLDGMKTRIPPESWRFLTAKGETASIVKITDSVGFRFKKENQDFVHAATVIFLSKEGKIVRYLPGLKLLGPDMKLAIVDAAEGRARSFMQSLQRLCYAYDSEGKTYVFMVNRIILAVTLTGLGIFLAYLLFFRRKGASAKKAAKVNEAGVS